MLGLSDKFQINARVNRDPVREQEPISMGDNHRSAIKDSPRRIHSTETNGGQHREQMPQERSLRGPSGICQIFLSPVGNYLGAFCRSIMGADCALRQPRLETFATWRSCGPTYARTRCPFGGIARMFGVFHWSLELARGIGVVRSRE